MLFTCVHEVLEEKRQDVFEQVSLHSEVDVWVHSISQEAFENEVGVKFDEFEVETITRGLVFIEASHGNDRYYFFQIPTYK